MLMMPIILVGPSRVYIKTKPNELARIPWLLENLLTKTPAGVLSKKEVGHLIIPSIMLL